MFTEISGIDEAALGPILGPYCSAVVSFSRKEDIELFKLFSSYKELKINDSKKLYSSGKTIRDLEKTALTFASLYIGSIPENLSELFSLLIIDKNNLKTITQIPWYSDISRISLPRTCCREEIADSCKSLKEFMTENGLRLSRLFIDAVPAARFNSYLVKGLNKGQTCQKLLTPLISSVMKENCRITVDRQGGRRYYGEWLVEMFPGRPISIINELQEQSIYRIKDSVMQFQVKGDEKFFETALASIFSKYIRELMMFSFNRYWQKKVPKIKKTAGYPQDGRRFIGDLKAENIEYEELMLIRQK